MIRHIYTLLYLLVFPFFCVWFLWQILFRRKYRRGFTERFGILETPVSKLSQPVIWIHAASVGEVLASEPIVADLKKQLQDASFFMTTNTDTGYATALKKIPFLNQIWQSPFDIPFVIKKFISTIQPDMLIVMETEIWPNMLTLAARHHVRVIIANGRLSDRSFPNYRRFRWFWRPILRSVNLFVMQSAKDAEKMVKIGAPKDRVMVAGNVKFDRILVTDADSHLSDILNNLGWNDSSRILVAGSTHPQEEEIICHAFKEVQRTVPGFRMILAPRHVNRVRELNETMKKYQLRSIARTSFDESGSVKTDGDYDVLILDVMGELATAYMLGLIAFVGGSLQKIGGHNVLEPATLGHPVLFGPFTENFREAVTQLVSVGGGQCVSDADTLASAVIDLSVHPEKGRQMGSAGRAMVERNRGAVRRHVSLILEQLSESSCGSGDVYTRRDSGDS